MSDLVLNNDATWLLFLFSFCISVLLIAQRLFQIVFRKRVSPVQEWLNTGFSIVVVAVLAVDAATSIRLSESPVLLTLLQVGIVLLTVLVSWLFVHLAFRGQLSNAQWRFPSIIILLIASAASAAWSSHRFYTSVAPEPLVDFNYQRVPGQSVPSRRFVAVTDQGREVELLVWKPDSERDFDIIKSLMTTALSGVPTTIQRADQDVRSNCHGWVFTNGRFLLGGPGVERILEDNGYEQVTEPQVGDVVIYRLPTNEITHTGLVQGVLGDGTVIVESKWSVCGRYLHLPEDQPYSPTFNYYRTNRKNHVVRIRFKDSAGEMSRKPIARGRASPRLVAQSSSSSSS